jgi:hypothetical protein
MMIVFRSYISDSMDIYIKRQEVSNDIKLIDWLFLHKMTQISNIVMKNFAKVRWSFLGEILVTLWIF